MAVVFDDCYLDETVQGTAMSEGLDDKCRCTAEKIKLCVDTSNVCRKPVVSAVHTSDNACIVWCGW